MILQVMTSLVVNCRGFWEEIPSYYVKASLPAYLPWKNHMFSMFFLMSKKGRFQMREKAGGVGEEREAGGQRGSHARLFGALARPTSLKGIPRPRWATSRCPSLAPSSCRVADLLGANGASGDQSQPSSSSQAKPVTWIYRSCWTVRGERMSSQQKQVTQPKKC